MQGSSGRGIAGPDGEGDAAARLVLAGHTAVHGDAVAGDKIVNIVPPAVSAANQLPGDPWGFTGRDGELAWLDARAEAASAGPAAGRVLVVHGMAGVGKTALAVHWAHRAADRFPDGQLYVDLRGYAARAAVRPGDALSRLLRALGFPATHIPHDEEEKAALYRSLLAVRKVLVVLDNAATPAQVRPLLPGSSGCLALVTSRARLPGLVARDGAQRIDLGLLTPPTAVELMARIIGAERIDGEPAAAAMLARLCGYLPLALRIAAERMATSPHRSLADLVGELTDEHHRLDVLATEDDESTAVRPVFSWSYQDLAEPAARVLRLIGLVCGHEVCLPAVAALAGAAIPETRRLLGDLLRVHLIEEVGRDRYRCHDLVRLYVAERAREEVASDECAEATGRLLTWYVHAADAASRMLTRGGRHVPLDTPPEPFAVPFHSRGEALAWCELEQPNLVAAVRQATAAGQDRIAWKLAAALWGFFHLRKPWEAWLTTHRLGLIAARRLDDALGEAWILGGLALAYREAGRDDQAVRYLRRALALWREIGDRQGEAITWNNLGDAYRSLGDQNEAEHCSRWALAIHRRLGDRRGEGFALISLGRAHTGLGRLEAGLRCFERACAVWREIGDLQGMGTALDGLGQVCHALSRLDRAEVHLSRALEVRREIGDRAGEAETLEHLAATLAALGRAREAATLRWEAVAVREELRNPLLAGPRHLRSRRRPGAVPYGIGAPVAH